MAPRKEVLLRSENLLDATLNLLNENQIHSCCPNCFKNNFGINVVMVESVCENYLEFYARCKFWLIRSHICLICIAKLIAIHIM